jgi:serine/threonine-protein kinase
MSLDPSTIGRYRVLGELGRGAMGVVYLAEDPLLKRGVAIKVVMEGTSMAREEALARFRREAETSARLAHPNIVTVFDVGEEPGLGPYMAMEHVEGQPLSELIARGPLSLEHGLVLLVQGFHALETAHAAGIIHRDVKAENVMVTKDGRLKLMDFGIARDEEPGLGTTALLCTPAYAAPELLDRQPASEATDRWAFCVTVYQCLTGLLPFRAASISGLLYQIAREAPSYPENLDPALRQVFDRAFAKDPSARYPDLRSFLRELIEACPTTEEAKTHALTLMDSTVTASLASALVPVARRDRWAGLPRWAWAAGGALGLALVLGLAFLWPRSLQVESTPAGAKVFVDGREVGTTPLQGARVPRGAQLLRLEKPGFQALERGLRPEDRRLALDLVPEPMAVSLDSDPQGAEVFVNGVLRGVTPLEDLQIPGEGSHRLQVRKAGFEPWNATVSRAHRPPAKVALRRAGEPRKHRAEEPRKPGFFRGLWDKVTGK